MHTAPRKKTILLNSAWDTINIGDIGQTPGTLAIFERHLPDVEVILWAQNTNAAIDQMLQTRFPKVQIIKSAMGLDGPENPELVDAWKRADLFIRNSCMGTGLSKLQWSVAYGVPFGLYGQSLFPEWIQKNPEAVAFLGKAAFIYCRDGVTLNALKVAGANSPLLEFAPDGTFGIDVRDEAGAENFLRQKGLKNRKFLAIHLRTNTNKHPGKDHPLNPLHPTPAQKADDERRAAIYREVIIDWVTSTGMKVLISPEVQKEMATNQRLLVDPLPPEIRSQIVTLDAFWNVDLAASILARARVLLCHEPHSPIIALANGTPAVHTFSVIHGNKAWMFKDIGLNEWLMELDAVSPAQITATLMEIHYEYESALAKVSKAMEFVRRRQAESCEGIARILSRSQRDVGRSLLDSEMQARRKQKAWKKRRVIFNNDGDDPALYTTEEPFEPTAERLLRDRTALLKGSHVDSIFHCTSRGFGVFLHESQSGSPYRFLSNPPGKTLRAPRCSRVHQFHKAGLDPLRVTVDAAHAMGMECFCSFRMNDTHDASPSVSILIEENAFKREHPEYLIGKNRSDGNTWSGVNYAFPEVRAAAAGYVREVLENYNVDGIELDFLRHAVFFQNTAKHLPCTESDLNAMSELMGEIRRLVEVESLKRGEPVLLAVRVPDSVDYCRTIGLDLERWLREGWIDLLITTSYFRLNPWQYSVELGHRYNVPVYASLDESRIKDDEARGRRQSNLGFRARAAAAWATGVDGLYLFNAFWPFIDPSDPDNRPWNEIGDPEGLKLLDKDYFASYRGTGRRHGLPHEPFQNVVTLNPTEPLTLSGTTALEIPFYMGDENETADARLLLFLKGDPLPKLRVMLNGKPLPDSMPQGCVFEWKIDTTQLVKGENQLAVQAASLEEPGAALGDLCVQIRH